MTIETVKHNGMIVITDIVNGIYLRQRYIDYSLADAKSLFREYVKTFKKTGKF